MKALRRILSRVADRGPAREQTASASVATGVEGASDLASAGALEEGTRKRRRRGRRGRGGRGSGAAPGGTATNGAGPGPGAPEPRSDQPAPRLAAEKPRSGGERSRGRDAAVEGGRRRGSGTIRGLGDRRRGRERRLEEPLPEDVAFRPAAEGGDGSLLPGRRRPPPGLRTTKRVILVGGRRYLPAVGASHKQPESPEAPPKAPPEPPHESPPDPELALTVAEEVPPPGAGDTTPAEDEAAPRRRRRGRRGGRRHRRGDAAPDAAEEESGGVDAGDARRAQDESGGVDAGDAPRAQEESGGVDAGDAPRAQDESGGVDAGDAPRAQDESGGVDAGDVPRAQDESGGVDAGEATPAEGSAAPGPRRAAPAVSRRPSGELPRAFSALGVTDLSLRMLAEMGFEEPTPIQERSIPALLAGRDVVGVAQTGSGKTLAFGLPLVERIDVERREVQAVVLVPTRELAQQVLGVLEGLAAPYGLAVVGLLGGRALAGDFRALEGRPHVVVGTPGRVLDHLRRGTLELRRVRYAVLDEADEMLDIGFLPDITRILQRTPRRRQTSLFSATMPHAVMRLVRRYMQDPETVSVAEQHDTVDTIDQYYVEVAHRDKLRGLRELVERELKGRTLVFSRTRRGVDYVSARLREMGVGAGALHGDMDQKRRDQVVRRFRAGELDLLVATNVAARGLDIPEITHVVNFDVPQNAEEYVHRVGRTGRAGRHGTAITLVSEHDIGEFDVLLAVFGDRMRQERLELYDPV